jgi:hypothetical protein
MIKTYLMYNRYTWKYKIGVSTNVKNRLSGVNTKNTGTVLICVIDMDIENFLHRNYLKKRVNIGTEKEWFDLTQENVEWIKLLSKSPLCQLDLLLEKADFVWEKGWNDIRYNLRIINNN